jgi:hypothetical protein
MAHPPDHIAVLFPLVIAVAMTFCTILMHALALIAIVRYVRREWRLGRAGISFWRDVTIVAGAALLALTAHLVEMAAWAVLFVLCGEFPHLAAAFYQSAENYTSLGYGDVVMSASWRLLGPLETADGMLMFGISTAMIFAVIQRLVQTRLREFAG